MSAIFGKYGEIICLNIIQPIGYASIVLNRYQDTLIGFNLGINKHHQTTTDDDHIDIEMQEQHPTKSNDAATKL